MTDTIPAHTWLGACDPVKAAAAVENFKQTPVDLYSSLFS